MNNDGFLDVAVANYGTNNVGILLGYGDGTFAGHKTYSTGDGSGPLAIVMYDLNNDSSLDISVLNLGTNSIDVLLGYGDGTFSNIICAPGKNSHPSSVVVGDLNNDDQLDIVVANFDTDNIGVLLGVVGGTFTNQATYSTGSGSAPFYVAIGDLNKDGRLDIAVANNHGDSVGILLGHGNGTFGDQTTYSTGSGSTPYCPLLSAI